MTTFLAFSIANFIALQPVTIPNALLPLPYWMNLRQNGAQNTRLE